jgi:fibronectin type 3 domain-containing protein
MMRKPIDHIAPIVFYLSALLPAVASQTATLAWDPVSEPDIAGYRVYYGTATRSYTGVVAVAAPATTVTVSNLQNDQRYFFAVTSFDADELESPFSDEISAMTLETLEEQARAVLPNNSGGEGIGFAVVSLPSAGTLAGTASNLEYMPNSDFYGRDRFDLVAIDANSNAVPLAMLLKILPVNDAPSLNAISNLVVDSNSGAHLVRLSGIGPGATNELQPLVVTAASSNRTLIPDPAIDYTSPASDGTLTFAPANNASGTAAIVVTVNDGEIENNTVSRTFAVQVGSGGANTPPSVNAGADKTVTWPSPAALAGSAADDGLPNPPGAWTASWSKVSGPGTVTFSSPANAISTATFLQSGAYVLRLTANDGQLSASDDLQVDVVDGSGPVVSGISMLALDARTITFGFMTDEPALCSMEYGTTSALGAAADEGLLTTNHTIVLSNLQPATNYFMRIRAVNQAANTSFSEMITASTPPITAIMWAAEDGGLTYPMLVGTNASALHNLYISSAIEGEGVAVYSVQIPFGSQYRLWYRRWTAGIGSFYGNVDGSAEFVLDAKETNGMDAWHWVQASNSAGQEWALTLDAGIHGLVLSTREAGALLDEFILSNDPMWAPGIDPEPPVLAASAAFSNLVSLTWTDTISNEAGFTIEVSADGSSFAELATVPAGTTNYAHQALMDSGSYYYRIYGFNESDRTEFSNVATVQSPGETSGAPSPPTDLNVTVFDRTHVRLAWTDTSANETGFIIERCENRPPFTAIQNVGANITIAEDDPPAEGRYYYRVLSFNEFGISSPSRAAAVHVR